MSQHSRSNTRADTSDSVSTHVLGLDLSKRLFETRGRAMLARLDLLECCSVGCIGGTSQNMRLDDEISRDHMWGPYLSFFLPEDEWEAHHDRLKRAVEQMPEEVDGIQFYGSRSNNIARKSDVYETDEYLRTITGMDSRPETNLQWVPILRREVFGGGQVLFAAGQGEVFHDPRNQFQDRWRHFVAFVSPDIQRALIARSLSRIWNTGPEYNLERIWRRKKLFTFELCFGEFLRHFFELVFYCNRSFTPFFKWREACFYRLPISPEPIRNSIERLSKEPNAEEKLEIAKVMIASAKAIVKDIFHLETSLEEGLTIFAQELHDTIEDPELKKQIPWAS